MNANASRWALRRDALAQALRFSLRSLQRMPGLSLGVILAFALGIGANAMIYQVIDRLLLRPPAQLHEAEMLRIVAVNFQSSALGREINNPVRSYPELGDLRAAKSLSGVAGYNYSPHQLTLERAGGAQRVSGLSVTGNYFSVLGVRPRLGRLISSDDDRVAAPRVVVLSYGFWQRQFGGRADVVGETVDFGQGAHTVIGVVPRGFTGVQLSAVDLWFPLGPYRAAIQGEGWDQRRSNNWLHIVARIAPGSTVAQAQAELDVLHRAAYADQIAAGRYPADSRIRLASLVPGESPLAPPEVGVTRWLVAVALVVLLIACINITNLLLARALRERRALGIRLALGVTRGRLVLQTLVEVTLFALLGGAAALLLARYGGAFVQRVLLPDVARDALAFSGSVALITLATALLAGLAAAVLPAIEMLRPVVLSTIRTNTNTDQSRSTARLRGGLVIAQVALSVTLLAGASLFLRSVRNATNWDLGVDLERAWFLSADLRAAPADRDVFYAHAIETLRSLPGVEAAAAASTMPLFQRHGVAFRAEGWDSVPARTLVHSVRGDYFAALGLRILAGRALDDRDGQGSPKSAVINQQMANTLYPGGALGRCLFVGPGARDCTRIVGIAENALVDGVGSAPLAQFYVSALQQPETPQLWGFPLRARAGANPAHVIASARAALAQENPGIRWVEATPFAELIDFQMRPWKLGATLFTLFGALALVVALLGLYAVMAFDVSQRTRELGVRAALGASPLGLVRLVLKRSVLLATLGGAGGVFLSLMLAPRLEALLFRVPARDLAGLTIIVLGLILAAAAAAWLPGRRAARADPLIALRNESL